MKSPAICDLLQLHFLIPFILTAVFVCDISLRFFSSIDPLSFTSACALSRNRPPYSAFEPGRHIELDNCYGGMALRIPKLRRFRSEDLTTDSLGYRNSIRLQKIPRCFLWEAHSLKALE